MPRKVPSINGGWRNNRLRLWTVKATGTAFEGFYCNGLVWGHLRDGENCRPGIRSFPLCDLEGGQIDPPYHLKGDPRNAISIVTALETYHDENANAARRHRRRLFGLDGYKPVCMG